MSLPRRAHTQWGACFLVIDRCSGKTVLRPALRRFCPTGVVCTRKVKEVSDIVVPPVADLLDSSFYANSECKRRARP